MWRKSTNWGSDADVGTWFGVTTDASTGRVLKLALNHNGLHGKLSDLSALDALEELELRGNSLTGSIPASIGGMTSIKELYLSANVFQGLLNDFIYA